MNQPSVAIVILNWNGRHYLQQFLPFVLQTDYPNFSVVVADNASTDDSVSYLEQHYSSVQQIHLPTNYGFAGGYNEALKQVQADYYVLLNSDVEVTPGWLLPLVDFLQKNPSVGACQPKIRAYHNRNLFEHAGAAGGWIDAFGYPFARGRLFEVCEADEGQYDDAQPVFWATGAALCIRSHLFHQLNGFDAYFFAHMEEIDLCWRLQLAGHRIYCCPSSVVYHVGGGALPANSPRKTFLNFRNNLLMLCKNLPLREKWWKLPLRFLLDWVAAAKALAEGEWRLCLAVFKAHGAFLQRVWQQPVSAHRKPVKTLEGVWKGIVLLPFFIGGIKTFDALMKKRKEKA